MVNPGERHLAMLPAVAHHYGLVNDRYESAQKKFQRNSSMLVYDVCEYPKNLRYLFQMANEYNHMADRRTAAVLHDGAASSGNVALLKQALADFPPFHEEIRAILTEMKFGKE